MLAGECCIGQVAVAFGRGSTAIVSTTFCCRKGPEPSTNTKPTSEQIADAIAAYQKAITETDKVVDDIVRRGGGVPVDLRLNLLDSPWKDDDESGSSRTPGGRTGCARHFPANRQRSCRNPGRICADHAGTAGRARHADKTEVLSQRRSLPVPEAKPPRTRCSRSP